jgi:hypothetical protein
MGDDKNALCIEPFLGENPCGGLFCYRADNSRSLTLRGEQITQLNRSTTKRYANESVNCLGLCRKFDSRFKLWHNQYFRNKIKCSHRSTKMAALVILR